MAKINESVLVIKVSELVPDSAETAPVLGQEIIDQLEAIIQELAGDKALVEVANGE